MDHYGYIEWIEKLGSRHLPVEDRRTMKNEWRTLKNGRNLREIPHGNVTEKARSDKSNVDDELHSKFKPGLQDKEMPFNIIKESYERCHSKLKES